MQLVATTILVFGLCSALPVIPGASAAEEVVEQAVARTAGFRLPEMVNFIPASHRPPAIQVPVAARRNPLPEMSLLQISSNGAHGGLAAPAPLFRPMRMAPNTRIPALGKSQEEIDFLLANGDSEHEIPFISDEVLDGFLGKGKFNADEISLMKNELHMADEEIKSFYPSQLDQITGKDRKLPRITASDAAGRVSNPNSAVETAPHVELEAPAALIPQNPEAPRIESLSHSSAAIPQVAAAPHAGLPTTVKSQEDIDFLLSQGVSEHDIPSITTEVLKGQFNADEIAYMKNELFMDDEAIKNFYLSQLDQIMGKDQTLTPIPASNSIARVSTPDSAVAVAPRVEPARSQVAVAPDTATVPVAMSDEDIAFLLGQGISEHDMPFITTEVVDGLRGKGQFNADEIAYMKNELFMDDEAIKNFYPSQLDQIMGKDQTLTPVSRSNSIALVSNPAPAVAVAPRVEPAPPQVAAAPHAGIPTTAKSQEDVDFLLNHGVSEHEIPSITTEVLDGLKGKGQFNPDEITFMKDTLEMDDNAIKNFYPADLRKIMGQN